MRKIAALIVGFVVAIAAIGTHFVARAGVTCSLPFQLQNATTADATQVMANYNALVTCLAAAAAAGANNDITSLAALSTPITNAQGGTPVYVGGVSTGSINAHIVSTVVPSNFALVAGRQVTFTAGGTNTGPTTLNVNGTGAVNVFRRSHLGISALVGGEIAFNQSVTVIYDGTEYQIVSNTPALVGEIRDYAGGSVPLGWAFIDGSCQLRAGVFADLFSVVGTAYDPTGSTCDVAHFALPDGRGRVMAGLDNMGINGAANRITNAGSGCTGSTLGGAGCGLQNHTQTLAELVSHTHTITDPQHSHFVGVFNGVGSPGSAGIQGTTQANNTNTGSGQALTAATGITGTTGSGSGNAMPILNPLQIVTKIIKL